MSLRQRLAIIKPRIFATSNGTKCGLLNARSVNKKEASISALITDCDLDFLFLTETWCHGNSSVSQERLKPRGYDAKFCNRDGKGGGGVGCVFRHSATVKPIPSKKCSSFDHLVLKNSIPKRNFKGYNHLQARWSLQHYISRRIYRTFDHPIRSGQF